MALILSIKVKNQSMVLIKEPAAAIIYFKLAIVKLKPKVVSQKEWVQEAISQRKSSLLKTFIISHHKATSSNRSFNYWCHTKIKKQEQEVILQVLQAFNSIYLSRTL